MLLWFNENAYLLDFIIHVWASTSVTLSLAFNICSDKVNCKMKLYYSNTPLSLSNYYINFPSGTVKIIREISRILSESWHLCCVYEICMHLLK